MNTTNTRQGWTSEHLLRPQGTAIYAAQQRERLRQMANEVQALLGEYRAALEAVRIDGDKPMEAKVRAFRATRSMAALEKHLRAAVNEAGKIDAVYNRFYVELPVKREKRAAAKELEKVRKSELKNGQGMQAVNAAASLHGISSQISSGSAPGNSEKPEEKNAPTFLDFLKGA